jgi:hypothetical protein
MSDGSDPTQVPVEDPVVRRPAGIRGFARSSGGKIALIGGAVAIVLVLIGLVWFLILGPAIVGMLSGGTPAAPTTTVPGSTPSTATASPSSTVTETIPAVASVDDRDVFVPRDPFKPIPAPLIPTETVSTSGGSSSTTVDEALVLNDIVTEDGVRKAVLTLAGTQYTVAAGEVVGTSPWKVIAVNKSSVVLLFGDDRVTLSLGQGITK